MERFEGALSAEDFVDIAVHRSETPSSFYSEKPIVYHQSYSASLIIPVADLNSAPLLASYVDSSIVRSGGLVEDDAASEQRPEIAISGVDIWVTSENLKLYFHSHHAGIAIQYPAISLIAVQRQAPAAAPSVYLQILIELGAYDDHDPESSISVTIVPQTPAPEETTSASPRDSSQAPVSEPTAAQILYTALTECANLHPDPNADSDSDAGGPPIMYEGDEHFSNISTDFSSGIALPPPMPGSGGWITADNVNQFFDEDGNFRSRVNENGETLGHGAGTVRPRDEDGEDADEEVKMNGDETKWRRTE